MSIKDLSTYITEEILIEIINRSEMPQIKGNDIPEAIDTFKKYGVPFKYEVNKTNDLNPIQNNAKSDKIERISIAVKSGNKMNPIFISNDNYIVDGHHRWLAYKNLNKDEIECIKIGYPKMAALKLFDKIADNLDEQVPLVFPDGTINGDPKGKERAEPTLKIYKKKEKNITRNRK
jgi:hypothetical protein